MKDRYEVLVLPDAEEDLWSIWCFIAQDSEVQADRWRNYLTIQAAKLSEFPHRAAKWDERYRMRVLENGYKIFYRVDDENLVVTVAHFLSPYQYQP